MGTTRNNLVQRDYFIKGDVVKSSQGKNYLYQKAIGFDEAEVIELDENLNSLEKEAIRVKLPLNFHESFNSGMVHIIEA